MTLQRLVRDSALALRTVRRELGLAVAIAVTLALGIGVNTAVFSVVDAVLLKPLPYRDPNRLLHVRGPVEAFITSDGQHHSVRADLRESPIFTGVAHYLTGAVNVGDEPAERVSASEVSCDFFEVLGATPALGRGFERFDTGGSVAVISHQLWRERYGGVASIVGTRVLLDGVPFEIVGVMGTDVEFPAGARIWVPTGAPTQVAGWVYVFSMIARLQDGVGVRDAKRDLVARSGMASARAARLQLLPIRESLGGTARPVALLVAIGGGLVLLVACINASNLLLARVARRQHDLTVRLAIGASPGQLVTQIGNESLLLACAGMGAAVVAAAWTLDLIVALLPQTLHGLEAIDLDARTLAAAAACTIAAAISCALPACLPVMRRTSNDVLRSAGAWGTDRSWHTVRRTLVAGEVAAAVVLLTVAVTLVDTVRGLMSVETGVRSERALAFELNAPASTYSSLESRRRLLADLESTLQALPDVEAVGLTTELPGRTTTLRRAQVQLYGADPVSAEAVALTASPGYFAATGIDIIAGRAFTASDNDTSAPVVVVSESYARLVDLRPTDIVGQRAAAYQGDGRPAWAQIVGVVRDVRMRGPEGTFTTAIYLPLAASPYLEHAPLQVAALARNDPSAMMASLRAAVARLDPALPPYRMQTFDETLATGLADRRFAMWMLLTFAGVASVLALIGLYAVTSYLVQARTREIGIRLALGASPAAVRVGVLTGGLMQALWGASVGIILVMCAQPLLSAYVPRAGSLDVAALGWLVLTVLGVAVAASWVPASRATRVDPALTLRRP